MYKLITRKKHSPDQVNNLVFLLNELANSKIFVHNSDETGYPTLLKKK